MNIATTLARKLLEIKAIKLNPSEPFTWASGIKSPIYCDNRITLSFPEIRSMIKEAFGELQKEIGPIDLIAGVATAGIPHGALLADYLEKPFIYVRSQAKSHGRQNQIEGRYQVGAKTLVVEDLISTGGSSLAAVEVLRNVDLNVKAVVSIFDYEFQKAKDNFKNHNCQFYSLSNYSTLIEEAERTTYITEKEKSILQDWNRDPESWFSKNYS